MKNNKTLFKRFFCLLIVFIAFKVSAEIRETSWCIIETPETAVLGESIEIKVTVKPGVAAPGDKISNHLHWMKIDGFGGMLSWRPGQDIKEGSANIFKHSPKLDSSMHTVSPLVFLSPDGDFANLTKRETGAPIRVVIDPVAEAAARAEAERIRRPEAATFKKSSIRIESLTPSVTTGDEVKIAVHYRLDPDDNWADGTKLRLMPLGPWIDNPDGKYTTRRFHVGIPGLGTRVVNVTPGERTEIFTYKLGKTFKYNDISWMANFIGGDGKDWPWHVRGGGMEIRRFVSDFDVVVKRLGGIFTYDETPVVHLAWGAKAKSGAAYTVNFKLTDAEGRSCGAFSKNVIAGDNGTTTEVPVEGLDTRGVILVEAEIVGMGVRDAFFARIPDLEKIMGNRRTPFGATNLGDRDLSQVARKLGLTYCRNFTGWNGIEPLPGKWMLKGLDEQLEANVDAGLVPWICLVNPPSWIIPGDAHSAGFEPFPFHRDLWRKSAETLAKRYSGKIWGFEWLNEIVPGTKSENPGKDYLEFCEIGTKAVKQVDPDLKIQMAGGLWPRNFRTDLLGAGIADYVDVLPVHYSNRGGIREAVKDARSSGSKNMTVWDNETAAGLSVWGMPAIEALTNSLIQSRWVMRNWPAELAAGAEAVIYFGGWAQSAGNWTYLLDKTTPRPVVATLAVMSSKIGLAKPIGTAAIQPGAVIHIFEKDGKGIAVASLISDKAKPVEVKIAAGARSILMTDHQGNESSIPANDGSIPVKLSAMPVFLEGFDLPTLAAHVGVALSGQDDGDAMPGITIPVGTGAVIPLEIRNPLSITISGAVSLNFSGSVETLPPHEFNLEPNEITRVEMPVTEVLLEKGTSQCNMMLNWTTPGDISVAKPFKIMPIRPESLGNLLKNGQFEEISKDRPVSWSGTSKTVELKDLGHGPGFMGRAMRFSGTANKGWQHSSQSITPPAPGQKYLYTAWVWTNDMQAGSNLSVDKKDYYIPAVFDAGQSTSFWRLLTHVRATPDDVKTMSFTPVTRGSGWAMYDNVRVTLYEGSDYATEASRIKNKINIDGDLSDWDFSDPIPLLCDNQISEKGGYKWSPGNLAGVAKFAWDENALYFAAMVRDDKHVATATGEETVAGDSIVIALHPENRADGTDDKAFKWYIGAAVPGGGSGVHTLYRPAAFSGGLQSGQLARDSSVYELSIKRTGDITSYELRIPWSETGGVVPSAGVKVGVSLQLNDKDDGAGSGMMSWGGGVAPVWDPSSFGVLTLIP